MNNKFNLLFLSLQSSHSEIFRAIIKELDTSIFSHNILDVSSYQEKIPIYHLISPRRSKMVERTISEYNPDLIVMANDQGINAHFIRVGRLRSIPSLAIQDGILSDSTISGWFTPLKLKRSIIWNILSSLSNWRPLSAAMVKLKFRPLVLAWGYGGASYYAVIGNASRRLLESRGIQSEKISVTGYPLLDQDAHYQLESGLENLTLPLNKEIILFLDQPLQSDNVITREKEDQLINSLVKSVDFHRFCLVIKLHPRDNTKKYHTQRIITDNKGIIVVKHADNRKLSAIASIVVTWSSTAAIWAIRLGKPVIFLNPFQNTESPLAALAVRVKDLSDLKAMIESLHEKCFTYDEAKVKEVLHEFDDKSSERVARLISDILNTRQAKKPKQ